MFSEDPSLTRKLPSKFEGYTFEGLSRHESFEPVRSYLETLRLNIRNKTGLLLSGPNGAGKTGFLVMAHKMAAQLFPQWGAAQMIWTRGTAIATEYQYGHYDEELGDSFDDILHRAPWMVIDELGREAHVKNAERRMHSLLQRRIELGRVTLFATNLSLNDRLNEPGTVRTVYGEGFWSLLHEACMAVTVANVDRRKVGS